MGDSSISTETSKSRKESGASQYGEAPTSVTKGGLFGRWGRNETKDDGDDYPDDEYNAA